MLCCTTIDLADGVTGVPCVRAHSPNGTPGVFSGAGAGVGAAGAGRGGAGRKAGGLLDGFGVSWFFRGLP